MQPRTPLVDHKNGEKQDSSSEEKTNFGSPHDCYDADEPRFITYASAIERQKTNVVDKILSEGRHYTDEHGEPFWLSSDYSDLFNLHTTGGSSS